MIEQEEPFNPIIPKNIGTPKQIIQNEKPIYPEEIERILNMKFDDLLKEYDFQSDNKEEYGYIKNNIKDYLLEIYQKDQEVIKHARQKTEMLNKIVIPTLTLNHSLEVANITRSLFEEKILPGDWLITADLSIDAALVHDFGKTKSKITADILNSTGKLTEDQMNAMKGHVKPTEKMEKNDPELTKITVCHHPGYWNEKENHCDDNKIGMVISLVDIYEALTSKFRSYSTGTKSKEKIFNILNKELEKIKERASEFLTETDFARYSQIIKYLENYHDKNFS